MNDSQPIFTIGHSNHEIAHFLSLLKLHKIQGIADVRSSPYSKFNPQFNRENLKKSLAQHGFQYVFLGAELGARRSEPECYRDNRVDYDLVAKTPAFKSGLNRLIDGASKMRIAMMCAEKDPLTCHRTILVARQLRDHVSDVLHILESGDVESQSEAEIRLLTEHKLHNPDLFVSERERLDLAYSKRAKQIAYVDDPTTETQ